MPGPPRGTRARGRSARSWAPRRAGLLYGIRGPLIPYLTASLLVVLALGVGTRLGPVHPSRSGETGLAESLIQGVRFVFSRQVILGALALDMLAVLFGGVVAILPVFAELLRVGPAGLGLLRAAQSIGAITMALIQTRRGTFHRAGHTLFFAVALFGLCIVGFALSTSFTLSLVLLAIAGMADNVSVITRASILQASTPDHMRGRVAAVNGIFIGSSNEIGRLRIRPRCAPPRRGAVRGGGRYPDPARGRSGGLAIPEAPPPPRDRHDGNVWTRRRAARPPGPERYLLIMDASTLDAGFGTAVTLIDAGDASALRLLLAEHPELACERLTSPGPWLRDQIGDALDGFFEDPYLLWFVAEDPVRRGTLPGNIAEIAGIIIGVARQQGGPQFQEQLDYALRLVAWSWIARDAGVQIALIDVLLNAGAAMDGGELYEGRFGSNVDAAIYNGNFAAAEHLIQRGASLGFPAALSLNRWDDVERLAPTASPEDKRSAFIQVAMHGNAEALRRMMALGVPPTTTSERMQAHATALHHAVWSGRIAAVRTLVEAGADLSRRDTMYDGTPLGWALYLQREEKDSARAQRYAEIAECLTGLGAGE